MRILFLGTPEFAVPTLQKLIDHPEMEVVGAVMQPDRPAGRGNVMHAPPTKELAQKHGVPVFQPEKLSKSPEVVEQLRALEPDYAVMVAFGQILRKSMLELPKNGIVNIHASLLPAYRGAAPINWCIINGDTVGGVTTMFTEAGVDTGPMLLKRQVAIGPDTTAADYAKELSVVGADLLIETLLGLENGTVQPEAQDESKATMAPMMTKDLGRIKWESPMHAVHNLVRGLCPWPSTFTTFRGAPLKIIKTRAVEGTADPMPPGMVQIKSGSVLVACGTEGQERLELLDVQPANKGRMAARDWANGVRLSDNDRFAE